VYVPSGAITTYGSCLPRIDWHKKFSLKYNTVNLSNSNEEIFRGIIMASHLVILPAFNEEMTVGAIVEKIKDQISFADILVVNDGSTDSTAEIAASTGGIFLVNHPFNLGYGAALQTGFRFAVKGGYKYVVTMDADGQHLASSISSLIETAGTRDADVVIGSRFIGNGYRIGLLRTVGIRLFALIARAYTGVNITDPTSGFQLLNRRVFSYLAEGDNYPLDYPDVNIIMALHKKEFKIMEAPVTMTENRSGNSMHSGLKPVLYVIKMFLAIIMVLVRRTVR
jgi:glycosyltransferase involved in cell wall biosynthesis